jgi:hypothetical protein
MPRCRLQCLTPYSALIYLAIGAVMWIARDSHGPVDAAYRACARRGRMPTAAMLALAMLATILSWPGPASVWFAHLFNFLARRFAALGVACAAKIGRRATRHAPADPFLEPFGDVALPPAPVAYSSSASALPRQAWTAGASSPRARRPTPTPDSGR